MPGFVIGPLAMGSVERVAGCMVKTRFTMINGLPLRALESFVDQGALNGGGPISIARHRRSVLAGFLRPWLAVLACALVLASAAQALLLALAIPLIALTGYMWLFYGQLSASETRRRLAYATWSGVPFDPLHLAPGTRVFFEAALRQAVDERAAQAPVGYRGKLAEPWRAVAAYSDDPELLIAALVRARVDRLTAEREEQAELDALHDTIWRKLDPLLAAGKAPRAYLDWSAHVGRDPNAWIRRPWLLASMIAAACVGAPAMIALLEYSVRPALSIVNASGRDGLTVLLDGEPIATRLPTARTENDDAFVFRRVKPGPHELVARDASGAEIDRRSFTTTQDGEYHDSFLYAPARSAEVCFFRELYVYADSERDRDYEVVKLDMPEPLFVFPRHIDTWYAPGPRTVDAGHSKRVERRSVRAWPCDTKLPR